MVSNDTLVSVSLTRGAVHLSPTLWQLRTVPVPHWVKETLDEWLVAARVEKVAEKPNSRNFNALHRPPTGAGYSVMAAIVPGRFK
jgi:hypothetical protein